MLGVAVSFPMKMGMGTNVAVGWLGSWVGMRTIVDVALSVGVAEGARVSIGVGLTVAVALGTGVLAGCPKPKGNPAQA